ncbi:hypothetical protein KAF25_008750 [Fusarium avenaceum]|uniref:Enoyl reductase (ER) domain-containing protein n=1 Tax=Fusarium avenaceum TaxID=40199 RepID=A0A9P7H9G0_9HYPO|nr:hypothetical protein KAF25_008750 [Fusarium avenaceum]
MKALTYAGNNTVSLQDRPLPVISSPTDAVIKVTKTTICGSDLHIRKGDVATCQTGTTLGHEGVGIVHSVGPSVSRFKEGDRVLISHCTSGGWILGHTINGVQAEYVRIPHADSSLHAIPHGVDEEALVMVSDIFPTGLECGVLNGKVQPGGTVVVVGAGPVGLAAIITAQMYSPSQIIAIDTDTVRLEVAKKLGATDTIVSAKDKDGVVEKVKALTDGKGCDSVIEAVGIPATFELCQELLAVGGVLANVGVHAITTKLVDTVTTPMLLKLVQSGKLQPAQLITHRFKLSEIEKAYETFGEASKHGALKVIIDVD